LAVTSYVAVGPEVRLHDIQQQRDNGQDHRGTERQEQEGNK